jgi:hypothetical protein
VAVDLVPEVSNEVVRLEKEQRDWLEVNKRMIANLSIYILRQGSTGPKRTCALSG